MTAEQELDFLLKQYEELTKLKDQLAQLRSASTGSRSEGRDGSRGTAEQDRMAGTVAEIMRLEERIAALEPEVQHRQSQADTSFEALPVEQRETMHYRYVSGYSWPQVASTVHQSIRTCYRQQAKAMRVLHEQRG